jgi:hypothetical protein
LGPRKIKYSLREVIVNTFIKEVPEVPRSQNIRQEGGQFLLRREAEALVGAMSANTL